MGRLCCLLCVIGLSSVLWYGTPVLSVVCNRFVIVAMVWDACAVITALDVAMSVTCYSYSLLPCIGICYKCIVS